MVETIAKWVQAVGTLFVGIALLTGVVLVGNYTATQGKGRTVQVSGKATRAIAPNQSEISGTFEEIDANQEVARKKAKEKAIQALEAIKVLGIEEKKISTTNVSVYPDYDYGSGKQKVTGYRGSTTLSIKLEDTRKADSIIATLTQKGAHSTNGPTLGLTTATKDQLIKELRLEAITDAKKQAEGLAKQAGGRLGRLISVDGGNESPDFNYPIPYAMTGAASERSAVAADTATDISVGEREITVTSTVIYQLR